MFSILSQGIIWLASFRVKTPLEKNPRKAAKSHVFSLSGADMSVAAACSRLDMK
jgi:hypothetical protein